MPRVYMQRFEADAMRHVHPRAGVLHAVVEDWASEAGYAVRSYVAEEGLPVLEIYVEAEDADALIAEWALDGRPGAFVPPFSNA